MSTPSTIPQPINIPARLRASTKFAAVQRPGPEAEGRISATKVSYQSCRGACFDNKQQLKELEILEKRLAETKEMIKSLTKEVPYLESGIKTFAR
jgi:hypothetical protein